MVRRFQGLRLIGRDNGPDVFVHYTQIAGEGYRTLKQRDRVEFEIAQGSNGPHVANVLVTDDPIKLLGLGLAAVVRLVGHRPEAQHRTLGTSVSASNPG